MLEQLSISWNKAQIATKSENQRSKRNEVSKPNSTMVKLDSVNFFQPQHE